MRTFRDGFGLILLVASWLLGGTSAVAAPAIQQAPQPVTVTAGSPAAFAVSATGMAPLHYDWRRDGASVGAPDQPNYTTIATTLADSGATISVVISDSSGSTPSPNAFLTVNPVAASAFEVWAAAITDPALRGPTAIPCSDGVTNLIKYTVGIAPNSQAAPGELPGIVPAGGGGWAFRFERDRRATGIVATAEQSASLVSGSWTSVAATKVADDGVTERWELPVDTGNGSGFLRLKVATRANVVPAIGTQPAGVTADAGQSPTFSVGATGTALFTYQWRKNGAAIAGATGASYTPPPLTPADNGARYTVLVTSEAGTVASDEAIAIVHEVSAVAALVEQVSLARYTANLRDRLFTHLWDNRGTTGSGKPSTQLVAARDLLIEHFADCGFSVTTQSFSHGGSIRTNVIATKLGTVRPGELVIVGGHYDSVGNPGANDNGSGTAALMEAAQVLGPCSFEATLRVIAFDAEEAGLVGSSAYVEAHPDDDVRCMLNVDTIAQDGGDHQLCIDSSSHLSMENQVAAAMGRYGQGITTVVRQTGDMSDHLSFESAGFTACEVYNNDWWEYGDPYNHGAGDSVDTVGYINFEFAAKVTRGVVGFLAEQAVLVPAP